MRFRGAVSLPAYSDHAVGVKAGPGERDEFAAAQTVESEADGELVAGSDPGAVMAGGDQCSDGFVLGEEAGGVVGLLLAVDAGVVLADVGLPLPHQLHGQSLLVEPAGEGPHDREAVTDRVVGNSGGDPFGGGLWGQVVHLGDEAAQVEGGGAQVGAAG